MVCTFFLPVKLATSLLALFAGGYKIIYHKIQSLKKLVASSEINCKNKF